MLHLEAQIIPVMFSLVAERMKLGKLVDERQPIYDQPRIVAGLGIVMFCGVVGKGARDEGRGVGDCKDDVLAVVVRLVVAVSFGVTVDAEIQLVRQLVDLGSKADIDGMSTTMLLVEYWPNEIE